MISLRCSDLPLLAACPAALLDGGLHVAPTHPAAADGTAVHAALRPLAEGGEVAWDGLPSLAAAHAADADQVRLLCGQATRLWREIAGRFPGARAEVALSAELAPGVTLSGHADLVAGIGDRAEIADWKTGRADVDHRAQMLGYCALALIEDPHPADARATILWVREGEIEEHRLSRIDLPAWRDRLLASLVWDDRYRPGPQCAFCPRAHDCPGAHALVRRDAAALTGAEGDAVDLDALPPAAAVDLYAAAGRMAAIADRVKAAIKARVERDGDLIGDGVRLTLQAAERRELAALAAWPVLQAHLEDTEIAAACRLSVAALEKTVAAKAGRGRGHAAVRELGAELEAAGAVRRTTTHSLVTRRTPP